MRGYYPRVSLKILPDSGDEPPPVLSRGQRDPDVNRNDKDGTWLAEAASVLWSMRPPMLGSTGPRVQHTTWLREQMWEFLRSRAPARVVSPSTRSGTNSHTFTVSILQSLVTCSYFVLAPSLAVSFPPPSPQTIPTPRFSRPSDAQGSALATISIAQRQHTQPPRAPRHDPARLLHCLTSKRTLGRDIFRWAITACYNSAVQCFNRFQPRGSSIHLSYIHGKNIEARRSDSSSHLHYVRFCAVNCLERGNAIVTTGFTHQVALICG